MNLQNEPLTQRQSMLEYQEQIVERLREADSTAETERTFITVSTEKGLARISGELVASVEQLTPHAAVPNIIPWVFGIANIRSRAIALVDLDAWLARRESAWRASPVPERLACLLLKSGDFGVVCRVMPELVAPADSLTIDFADFASLVETNTSSSHGEQQ